MVMRLVPVLNESFLSSPLGAPQSTSKMIFSLHFLYQSEKRLLFPPSLLSRVVEDQLIGVELSKCRHPQNQYTYLVQTLQHVDKNWSHIPPCLL